jgi:hypothetical protein
MQGGPPSGGHQIQTILKKTRKLIVFFIFVHNIECYIWVSLRT